MTIEEAAKILHDYQRWRRGVTDLLRPTNKEIGEAIDEAIRILRKVERGEIQLKETKLEGLIKDLQK
jgi:hypothetical protein